MSKNRSHSTYAKKHKKDETPSLEDQIYSHLTKEQWDYLNSQIVGRMPAFKAFCDSFNFEED